jgi:hypothetical protein
LPHVPPGVQQGLCVIEVRPRVTEAPTRRAGRHRYHNLQRAQAWSYGRAANRSHVQLAKATTRQGKGYAVGHTPRGRVDKTGRAGRCLAPSSHDI